MNYKHYILKEDLIMFRNDCEFDKFEEAKTKVFGTVENITMRVLVILYYAGLFGTVLAAQRLACQIYDLGMSNFINDVKTVLSFKD